MKGKTARIAPIAFIVAILSCLRRSTVRGIYKLGTRLGPRGCVLFLAGINWILEGGGVFSRLDGHSHDAPHIMYMPYEFRGAIWVVSGIVAIITSFRRDWGHIGAAVLWCAPLVRVCSYMISWILDITSVEDMFADTLTFDGGDGWYFSTIATRGVMIALFATWAPISWSRFDAIHGARQMERCSKDMKHQPSPPR